MSYEKFSRIFVFKNKREELSNIKDELLSNTFKLFVVSFILYVTDLLSSTPFVKIVMVWSMLICDALKLTSWKFTYWFDDHDNKTSSKICAHMS